MTFLGVFSNFINTKLSTIDNSYPDELKESTHLFQEMKCKYSYKRR